MRPDDVARSASSSPAALEEATSTKTLNWIRLTALGALHR